MSFFSKGVAMDGPIDGKNPSCNKDRSTGSQQSSSGLVMLQKSSLKCLVFIICIMNSLQIVELAFKHQDPEIRKASYKSWRVLMDNFALDIKTLGNPKRIKLIIHPLEVIFYLAMNAALVIGNRL